MLSKLLVGIAGIAVASATTAELSKNYTCPPHLYEVKIFSEDPLVIYIPEFITPAEASHLQKITEGKFSNSQIADQSGQQQLASTRTSQSTSLSSDPIVSCIENRALSFQGHDISRTHLEPLQLVHYSLNQNYAAHTDWFEAASHTTSEFGGNRQSSFFVYVAAEDIVGGGTQFPLLDAPKHERWCDVVNCDAAWEEGVTFRPIPRNAVFWKNMKDFGGGKKGDRRTLHAGLPVHRGKKLGMNIWTREGELDARYRSDNIN